MATHNTGHRPLFRVDPGPSRIGATLVTAMAMTLVLLLPAPVAAATSPIIFNARDGFRVSPNQANPSGPWSYRRAAPDGSKPLLESFSENAEPCGPSGDGINSWFGPEVLDLPAVSRNATGSDAFPCGAFFPEGALMVHPHDDGFAPPQAVIVRWTSPMAGMIRIRAAVIDRDSNCGEGVNWVIQIGNRPPIAKGTIRNGGWMTGLRTGPYLVNAGSKLELRVGSGTDDNRCDSTQVRLRIALTPSS